MATTQSVLFRPALPAVLLAALCLGPAAGCSGGQTGGSPNGGDAPGRSPAGEASARPNVIILTVDTLRADRVGSYGSTASTTPAIDALAARGVRFERAYTPLPKTNPSLCSLMTGRYPSAHGVRRNGAHLPESELTLAELLQAAGYRTAAFISNHVMHSRHGLAQGFQLYDQELPDPIPTRDAMERTAGPLADAVLAWAADRRGDGPLFLWVHFIDPHGPYTPPGFVPAAGDASEEVRTLPVSETNDGSGVIPAYQALPGVTRADEYVARYDAEVEHMDRELGRLVEGLQEAGILEGALVIFSADHGESLGGHDLWFQHGSSLYEPQIRVPLIIAGPGIAPAVRPEIVSNVDVAPTILDLVGLRIHGEVQGRSLAGSLRGEAPPDQGRIIHAELDRLYAAIRGKDKLIWNATSGDLRLFDVDRDPEEATNLAGAAAMLRAELATAAGSFARENTRDLPVGEDEETLKVLRSLGYVE